MEDIPVTIEQNSLINGPTNRSSCLHEGGGGGVGVGRGANIVIFPRCMLGSSPVHVTHGQPMPNSLALIAKASCMQWFPTFTLSFLLHSC